VIGADGTLYIGSADGKVYAFKDGRLLLDLLFTN
jgi:outer membrane protein assembly factor BamB